jgi:hypothetical protein
MQREVFHAWLKAHFGDRFKPNLLIYCALDTNGYAYAVMGTDENGKLLRGYGEEPMVLGNY